MSSTAISSVSVATTTGARQDNQKKILNYQEGLNKNLWLIKIPQYVSDMLESAENGDIIGSMQIDKKIIPGKPGASSHSLSVELSFNGETEQYVMQEIPIGDNQGLAAFSSDIDNNFQVKGNITKNYNLNPKDTESYRKRKREESLAASKGNVTRSLAIQDVRTGPTSTMEVDFIPPKYAEIKRAAAGSSVHGGRRSRSDVDARDIRGRIFEAFSKNERLPLKAIIQSCEASEKEVKDVLKQYATFHSKGPHRNLWELNSDIRISSDNNS